MRLFHLNLISLKFLLVFWGFVQCSSAQNRELNLDFLPVDTIKGYIGDTIFIDLNNDDNVDLIFKYFTHDPRDQERGNGLLIYTQKDHNSFVYRTISYNLIPFVQHNITFLNDSTFVIINQPNRDFKKYYCVFQYDSKNHNWYLIQFEVVEEIEKGFIDKESGDLIKTGIDKHVLKTKMLTSKNKIPFDKVDLMQLFSEFFQEE